MSAVVDESVRLNAPIATWLGVGGRADALAAPGSIEELSALIERFNGEVRVVGAGANLLVDDAGVGGLVVSLARFNSVQTVLRDGARVRLRIGAGVNLPRLIVDAVRDGLGGLEGLGGVPASIGGAVRMNAGGANGEIASTVRTVRGVDRRGRPVQLDRKDIAFGYRTSGLESLFITEVELELAPGDPAPLRRTLKEVMAHKKKSQPMADRSAGCIFKNPIVSGRRVSAGRLIDRAGCKGLGVGAVEVSQVHGNFFVTRPGATARDVMELIDLVGDRVRDHAGVTLDTEVVIWRRNPEAP